jgi:anti-anti-sigma factor
MELQATTEGSIAVVRITGALDTKASSDFERKVLELFGGGARVFAFNLAGVTLLTSAAIRVLMMLAKRLGGLQRIAICSPNEQVAVVFRISGLAGAIHAAATEADAIAHLAKIDGPAPASDGSQTKLARRVFRLLRADVDDAGEDPPRRAAEEASALANHIAGLVALPERIDSK